MKKTIYGNSCRVTRIDQRYILWLYLRSHGKRIQFLELFYCYVLFGLLVLCMYASSNGQRLQAIAARCLRESLLSSSCIWLRDAPYSSIQRSNNIEDHIKFRDISNPWRRGQRTVSNIAWLSCILAKLVSVLFRTVFAIDSCVRS
jgi:hypothetical protein